MVPEPVAARLPPEPTTIAAVVFVPLVIELKAGEPPPEIVLHPNPVPLVQMRAFEAPEQEGSEIPLGVVAVNAPRTVFAACVAREALGIALAATASNGVVVVFVTVGTNHEGHDPEGAAKLVTVPLPEIDWHEPSPRRNVPVLQVPLHSPITSLEAARLNAPVVVVFLMMPVPSVA
jgi:hypothetical protein